MQCIGGYQLAWIIWRTSLSSRLSHLHASMSFRAARATSLEMAVACGPTRVLARRLLASSFAAVSPGFLAPFLGLLPA